MNTILVWILVTANYTGNGYRTVTYSPPMADLESCQRMSDVINKKTNVNIVTECVQIRVVK
jgi:hypothetical protein